MPNKPIIDIDVNDEKFKAFYALFQKYQEGLGTMPEDWKKVNDASSESGKVAAAAAGVLVESMVKASEHAKEISGHLKSATTAQKQFQSATRQSESALKKTVHQAEKLGKSIFGIGKFMFKTAAWGVGLLGGATFGMDKLAGQAVNNQRSARGLGMTTGQYRAFGTDMGRYVDSSLLSKISSEQSSYSGRVMLARASGMTESQLSTANPGDVAIQLAMKAHQWWKNTPASMRTSEQLQATGFPQSGLTLEDMKRLGATSSQDLLNARSQYQRDSTSLNIGNKTTDAFYYFRRQLGLAGQKIETSLTNKISSLAGPMGAFITNLEKDAEILIGGILTPANLKAVEGGMKSFATYLGSADFRNSVTGFVNGMKKLFHVVDAIVHPFSGKDDPANPSMHPYNYAVKNPDKHGLFPNGAPGPFAKRIYMGPNYEFLNPLNPDAKNNQKVLSQYENDGNLPHGLLASLIGAESSGNANALSAKGAKGLMQLMPSVIHDYGVSDPNDPSQNVRAGTAYLRDLMAHYKTHLPADQLRMALAAYNEGPGNVDKDIAKNGAQWDQHLYKGVPEYVNKIINGMNRRNNGHMIGITITNKTGNSVAVSANAAAK